MWRDLYDVVRRAVLLAEDVQAYRAEVKETQEQLRDLVKHVYRIEAKVDALQQQEATERKAQLLEIKNELLQFRQQLPQHPRFPPAEE